MQASHTPSSLKLIVVFFDLDVCLNSTVVLGRWFDITHFLQYLISLGRPYFVTFV